MTSIVFLREFQPSVLSGSSTPASDKPNSAVKGKGKEKRYTANDPFIPENVYHAMKENKRFDSLRVSSLLPHSQVQCADSAARSPGGC